MSKIEKLLQRLQSRPSDFTWRELCAVMTSFGFELHSASGSARRFVHPNGEATLYIHEPHPGSILKAYQVRDAIALLKQEKFL